MLSLAVGRMDCEKVLPSLKCLCVGIISTMEGVGLELWEVRAGSTHW